MICSSQASSLLARLHTRHGTAADLVSRNRSASLKPWQQTRARLACSGGKRTLATRRKLSADTETRVLETLTQAAVWSGGQMSAPPEKGDTVTVWASSTGMLSL